MLTNMLTNVGEHGTLINVSLISMVKTLKLFHLKARDYISVIINMWATAVILTNVC